MALDAYTAGLTAAQLTAQAEALAGSPNLNLNPTTAAAPVTPTEFAATPAYVALNEILVGLYTQYEWPFLETGVNIVITARENALPTDFWRIRFPDPLILINGEQRIRLRHVDPQTFFSHQVTASPPTGTPSRFSIDKNRSSFFVDPTPDKAYNAELHYAKYIPRLTATTTVPLFPHPDLLVQLLVAWYYQHQDDTRWQTAKAQALEMLGRIRASAYEDRDATGSIPLDSHLFTTPSYDW